MGEYGRAWQAEYRQKTDFLIACGFDEVDTLQFYKELFVSDVQRAGAEHDGNGKIIVQLLPVSGRDRTVQFLVDDSFSGLDRIEGDPFPLIQPITHYGRSTKADTADRLYALVLDVDFVGIEGLKNLVHQCRNGIHLQPTYLVNSGRGVHLYYFLEEPQKLYRNFDAWAKLKKAYIERIWNDTVSLEADRDKSGIVQGFRAVGGLSKMGEPYSVTAWKLTDKRYTFEELNNALPEPYRAEPPAEVSRIPLALAKVLFPEWHARVIEGKSRQKKQIKGNTKADAYNDFLQKINTQIQQGGRYFAVYSLCCMGLKCNIPQTQIKADAWALFAYLESLTTDENNHFTEKDMYSAFKALRPENRAQAIRTTRQWMADRTKMDLTPKIRRREKGRRKRQADHLADCRAVQKAQNERNGTNWRAGNGRHSKEDIVMAWRFQHPIGTKAECIKDTGLSKSTVYRHWNADARRIENFAGQAHAGVQNDVWFDLEKKASIPKRIEDRLAEIKTLTETVQKLTETVQAGQMLQANAERKLIAHEEDARPAEESQSEPERKGLFSRLFKR